MCVTERTIYMVKICLAFLKVSHSRSSFAFSFYDSYTSLANPDGIERYNLKFYLLFNLASCIIS